MTAKRLVEILQACDPEMEVYMECGGEPAPVQDVAEKTIRYIGKPPFGKHTFALSDEYVVVLQPYWSEP